VKFFLSFDVSSGVDEDLLECNLSALANLPKVSFNLNNGDKTFTDHFIAHVLLSWFVSMGISVAQVQKWLIHCIKHHYDNCGDIETGTKYPDAVSSLVVLNSFFVKLGDTKLNYDAPTLYPLPSFINVRYINFCGAEKY
jgi:hypothetical protein